jgi:RNA-directed DNA polymerase
MRIIDEWSIYFDQNNVSTEQKKIFLRYIERLLLNNAPIIFEFNHLACLLGCTPKTLASLTICTDKSYRSFKIPKKNGTKRTIASPYPALSRCQNWIYRNILANIDPGEYSFAFRHGRSIIDNAKLHISSDEILKVDIANFFQSIRLKRVVSIFKNIGYPNKLSFYLASICCYKGALPQGACTSPIISNIIAKRLDKRLSALCNKLGLIYSRYADDITISGKHIPISLAGYIAKIVQSEGFVLNDKKTVYKTKGQKKIVTGLCVSGDEVRIPKSYRKKFKQEIYFLTKNGIKEFNGEIGKLDPLYIDRLIGKANFILAVEPSYKFAIHALSQLKEMKKQFIQSRMEIDQKTVQNF